MAGPGSRILEEQLALARKLLDPNVQEILASDVARLAELTLELDRHIKRGMPLPSRWFNYETPKAS